jgi:hypothetical protein
MGWLSDIIHSKRLYALAVEEHDEAMRLHQAWELAFDELQAEKRGLQDREFALSQREKRVQEREEIVTVRLTCDASPALKAVMDAIPAAKMVYHFNGKPVSEKPLIGVELGIHAEGFPSRQGVATDVVSSRLNPADIFEAFVSEQPDMQDILGDVKAGRAAMLEPGAPIAPFNVLDQLRAANIARNPEWFPDGAPPVLPASFRGLELAGEVGEGVEAALTHLAMLTASAGRICNIIKKLERERLGLNGSRSTKQALADEIGDFIVCADLIGMDFGIDLWPSTVSKFNGTSIKLGMKTMLPYCGFTDPVEEEEEKPDCSWCGGDGNNANNPEGYCESCFGTGKEQ